MKIQFVDFKQRSDRYEYLAREFFRFLSGSVLDVGCDRAVLKSLLPTLNYTGIDVEGNPTLRLDLEKIDRLPFDNDSFDCVLCLEVLEHLDNLHSMFSEAVRVAKRYMILSLPNNWSNARRPIERGRGSIGHYGLPVIPIRDRHKWFFSLSEARDFIEAQQATHPVSLVEFRVSEKPRPVAIRILRRLRYPRQERYLNRYAHTLWAVLEKRHG